MLTSWIEYAKFQLFIYRALIQSIKGLAPEYVPGSPKWRIHMIAMTEAKEILGGYKTFVQITEIMGAQSQPAAKNPLWNKKKWKIFFFYNT
jgi:hypothetical protein